MLYHKAKATGYWKQQINYTCKVSSEIHAVLPIYIHLSICSRGDEDRGIVSMISLSL